MVKPTSSATNANSNPRVKGKAPGSAAAPGTVAGSAAVGSKLPPPGSYRKTPSPSSSTSSSQKPTSRATPTTTPRPPIRPVSVILPSLAIFAFTAYGTYLYTTYTRAIHTSSTLPLTPTTDVSDRYDKTFPTYDSEVDTSEWLMNLPRRRRELVQRARGDVLEVSCGTGRNLEFFEIGERRGVREGDGKAVVKGVRSLTLVDRCAGMVGVARAKFGEVCPPEKGGREWEKKGVVRFLAQDAMERVSAPPTSKRREGEEPFKFDTVIQTMGLCSHPEPVELLRHLGTITEPENGQILLLEHGRSYYGWVNRILDGLAAAHADRHGCWWNRDIGDVVERSGLVVVERKRWHLGTTWGFVLRPAATREQGKVEGGK